MKSQGKLNDALQAYRDALVIAERLAAADRSNTEWQNDLALIYSKLALVYPRLGNNAEALTVLHKGRDIMAALVTVAPSHAEWKNELAWFDSEIAKAAGRGQKARKN